MRVACLATKGFEDSELSEPKKALEQAGHEVVVISPTQDAISGYHGRVKVTPDETIDDALPEDYDALFIPGGYSPDQLRADDRFLRFVVHFDRTNKPMLAICHGPQLLFSADVLDGRRLTAWKTVQHDLRAAGIDVEDKEVVMDDNLVTSRQPGDIPAFNRAILDLLRREEEVEGPRIGGDMPSATL